jgi:peptide/nickel transport system permease protein
MAATTGWFPITGMHSAAVIEGTVKGWPAFVDLLRHLVLPTFTLAFGGLAGLMRYARGTMLDVLNEDYVIFARAKGLPENKVIYKHALRNAINPLVTMLGYSISGLLGGAVITETIFGWPGLGRLIYQALMQQDIYMVMASTIINTVMLIVGNFIADILLAWVDPRVRLQMGQ